MRALAGAFAWDLAGRQRLLVALGLGYLLALALLVNVLPAGTLEPRIVLPLCFPLWFALPHLLALFTHGDQADLVGRESGYPRRAFTLPVRTAALAGWPLALGGAVLALYWLVLAGLVLRAADLAVPVLWPAVFLVALLAWVQALVWWPFPLPLARILVTVPVLVGMVAGAVLAYQFGVRPGALLAASAALIPAGYLVAVAGLARARRGDVPVWRWSLPRRAAASPRRPFPSEAAALRWLEWRRHGFVLPLLVGLVLMAHGPLLYFSHQPRPIIMALIALAVYMLGLAGVAGISLGNTHPWSRKLAALPAFLAARPVRSAELLAAKLRVAARSVAVSWALLVLVLLAVLPFCKAGEVLAEGVRQLIETGGVKGWAVVALIALGLPLLSGKCLVNQLWIGLTGRRWVVVLMSVATPTGFTALAVLASWLIAHREAHAAVVDAIPWAVGVGLALKLGAGMLVARALLRRGLLAPRTLAALAVAWVAAAAALAGLSFWLMPAEIYAPAVVAGAAVLLALPLVRLGLAPLALEANRHR